MLTPVDGGPDYYSRFPNPLPTTSDYFPMAVWGTYNLTAENIDRYKALGINFVNWVADPNTDSQLTNLRSAGLKAWVDGDEVGQWSTIGSETAGYMVDDELDMICGP